MRPSDRGYKRCLWEEEPATERCNSWPAKKNHSHGMLGQSDPDVASIISGWSTGDPETTGKGFQCRARVYVLPAPRDITGSLLG
jgi:hypothetical protein